MTRSASSQRQMRAATARRLLALYEQDALAEPERWTWEEIDRMPLWCLLPTSQRERVQRVTGALMMAPEMRLWISAQPLDEAERLLGVDTLAAILERADALSESQAQGNPPHIDEDARSLAEGLDARMMAAGASVLTASLPESFPHASLADTLGPTAGELSPAIAVRVLAEAEQVLAGIDDEHTSASDMPPAQSAVA